MSKNEPWFEFRRAQSTPVIMPLMPGASLFLPRLPAPGRTRDIKKTSLAGGFFMARTAGRSIKNNRCSGCFCLQNLCNILMSKESVSDRGEFRCLSEENCARTVRVIRAYSLISPAPSVRSRSFLARSRYTPHPASRMQG